MNPYDLAQRVKKVKFLLLDADGVLTDGGLFISEKGIEHVRFDVKDGMGIILLKENGYGVGIISGRVSKAIEARAKSLGISDLYQGVQDKATIYEEIKEKYGLSDAEIAYIGDDINDIPILEKVGLPISVADGSKELKNYCQYFTRVPGGRGAIREVADLFLTILKRFPVPDMTYSARR